MIQAHDIGSPEAMDALIPEWARIDLRRLQRQDEASGQAGEQTGGGAVPRLRAFLYRLLRDKQNLEDSNACYRDALEKATQGSAK
jgi:hypothetical protein